MKMLVPLSALLPVFVIPVILGQSIATIRYQEICSEDYLDVYHPTSVYETFGVGLDLSPSISSTLNISETAGRFLQSRIGVGAASLKLRTSVSSEVGHHLYYSQTHNGILFANAVVHVSLTKSHKIASFSSSSSNFTQIAPSKPTLDLSNVLPDIEETLGGDAITDGRLEYLARENGTASLVYVVEIQNLAGAIWYEAFIDAHSGELLSVTDFISTSTYRALPIDKPSLASRQVLISNPEDLVASPLGWHDTGLFITSNTTGNNVETFKWLGPGYVYTNASRSNATTSVTGVSHLMFDYPVNTSLAPDFSTPAQTYPNLDAARVNAFYALNALHDLSWKYGFTEDAFNFQTTNLGGRGNLTKANDPVRVSIQATDVGVNNAFFASPADGTPGFCYMLFWDYTSPERDGALANDILTHEYMHGVTNRMTGGGTSRCLQSTESNGLGEGWSDIMAEWTELTAAGVKDYTFGAYVAGNTTGLRHYSYSKNATVNPWTYADIESMIEPHDVGEVWANTLHNLLASLISEYGWADTNTAMKDPTRREGNVVFLHLIMDALPLQPCNPTFPQARDAILQADFLRYDGANRCRIWAVFASRGLGLNAQDYVDNFDVPSDC